jgi:hypothetical protein
MTKPHNDERQRNDEIIAMATSPGIAYLAPSELLLDKREWDFFGA